MNQRVKLVLENKGGHITDILKEPLPQRLLQILFLYHFF